jgi:PAS domain S-box-containing protein
VPRSLPDLTGLKVDAEDFFAAVLETAAQPIWVVDPDGTIRFANPAAIAALGYDDADQLLSRFSHETIHCRRPDGRPCPAAERPMLLPRATGRTVRDLDWFFRRDGSTLPLHAVWLRSTPMGCLLRFHGAERSWDCPMPRFALRRRRHRTFGGRAAGARRPVSASALIRP